MKNKVHAVIALFLVVCLFLSACSFGQVSGDSQANTEIETDGPYMSGKRQGTLSFSLPYGYKVYEYAENGMYFIQDVEGISYDDPELGRVSGSAIFYADYGSDTVIKLCSRPDCTHDSFSCNAIFASLDSITVYDNMLYVLCDDGELSLFTLYRMNLDGTDRAKVMDGMELAEIGFHQTSLCTVINGYLVLTVGNGDSYSTYYCKLDDSEKKLRLSETSKVFLYSDGNQLLDLYPKMDEDTLITTVYQWDPETDQKEELFCNAGYTDGVTGVTRYCSDRCFMLCGGEVRTVAYDTGEQATLFDSGIENASDARYFPDVVVICEPNPSNKKESKLHFFDWNGKDLGEIPLGFQYDRIASVIVGETHERLLLSPTLSGIPQYYINKSDFGTGKIELHKFEYPDLSQSDYQDFFTPNPTLKDEV